MTRRLLGLSVAAVLGGLLVGVAQATGGLRLWVGCPGDFDSPPCVMPPWWSWAKVSAVYVTIGAVVGAGLVYLLAVLAQRVRRRRRHLGRTVSAVATRRPESHLFGAEYRREYLHRSFGVPARVPALHGTCR